MTAYAVIGLIQQLDLGWNRHVWDLPFDKIVIGQKLALITYILFSVITTLTKCSMLVLIYRILAAGSSKIARIAIAVLILVAIQGVVFCTVEIFQCGLVTILPLPLTDAEDCRKPSLYWTISWESQPTCMSETHFLLAFSVLNTVTDLMIVILPMHTVSKLGLPIQQQIIVCLLFSAGLLVTCAGAARTFYLYEFTTSWDRTWHSYPALLSSYVELYVGIVSLLSRSVGQAFINTCRYVPVSQ